MDKDYKRYIEWKKPDTKKQCLVWLYIHKVQKEAKLVYALRSQKSGCSWGLTGKADWCVYNSKIAKRHVDSGSILYNHE